MKFVRKVDNVWHDSDKELPPISTKVEFMDKKGNIHKGGIQVDMAYFVYTEAGFSSFSEMIKWRFIPGQRYIMYENLKF